jgi:hypothetical protein
LSVVGSPPPLATSPHATGEVLGGALSAVGLRTDLERRRRQLEERRQQMAANRLRSAAGGGADLLP